MSSDELSLMWDDHHDTLVKIFGNLLETSSLVDCTIAAEGQYIKAHKIILSACSPYFELLFNQENEKNPIVVLKDIKFQELKSIIDFMYCGNVRVPEDRLEDFVDAAESLQIKGLGADDNKTSSCERSDSPCPPKQGISDSSSPVPRKRRRPLSISEDNVSEIFSGTNVSEEYQDIESVPQDQKQVDKLGHQIGEHSYTASASDRLCSSSVTEYSIQKIVETDSSASFAEPSPVLEIFPNHDIIVVKTEPQTLEEVILPETDFESQGEDDVEEDTVVLDSGDGVPEAVLNADPQSSNQYSGAVETHDKRGRPLPTTKAMHPERLTIRGVLVSAFRHPVTAAAARVAISPSAAAAGNTSRTGGHSCHFCGKVFRSPSALNIHTRQHTGDRPYSCEQCGKSFTQSYELQRHQLIHTGERPFVCEQCGKTFKRLKDLQIHQRCHTGNRPYSCEQCGKSFTQSHVLHRHRLVHTGERPFVCEQCGKTFRRREDLQIHQRCHTGERPYKCEECGVTSAHRNGINQHMLRVHGSPREKQRPPTQQDTGDRRFKCEHCDKTFTFSHVLQQHLRVHTGERPFACGECGKTFKRKEDLQTHQRNHTGERPYRCGECGLTSAHRSSLYQHMRRKHGTLLVKRRTHTQQRTVDRPFKCELCDKAFTSLHVLQQHQLVHTDERPFACGECAKAFKRKEDLRTHQRCHTGERPYKCNVCGVTSAHRNSINQHMRNIHGVLPAERPTGDRSFRCELCDRVFSSLHVLQRHLVVHSGERPFVCEQCGKAFKRKDDLQNHLRIHTGEKP